MKQLLAILFLFSFFFGFSQNKFPKMPENSTEIHFTYQRKSNTFVDEKGFYADSTFCKIEFPDLKFSKVQNPVDKYLNAFIPFNSFKKENKRRLVGLLYHGNEIYKGIYYFKNNKTIINAERNDSEIRGVFKKYFKKSYSIFKYNKEIDYNVSIQNLNFPLVSYTSKFDEIQKYITWKSDYKGVFQERNGDIMYSNLIKVDENLSKYISLGYLFENNKFGVLKIESINERVELLSVSYK